MQQIKDITNEKVKILDKLNYLDETIEKISLVNNSSKKLIIRDIQAYKKDIIKNNLAHYTAEKYFTGSQAEFIKEFKPYYTGMKNLDIKADIHPNYITKLENEISKYIELNENSITYKTYIYVLFAYTKNKDLIRSTTESKLNTLENFSNTQEYSLNKNYYKSKFDKFNTLENVNIFSKDDFNRIYNNIIKEKISPESDYMRGFFYWYATYKKILGNSTLTLNTNFGHSKQLYTLSCEANSTKDFINYLSIKNGLNLVSENEVLSMLPSYTGGLTKNKSNELVWYDPSKIFVGNVEGKQSTNINNFTGYGVYAEPIIKVINEKISIKNLEIKKSTFDEQTIIESINSGHPVVFWYLSQVKKGKTYGYNTQPINWKTPEGNIVAGYIGEHTGIITGIDISKAGAIENIYYYEGKSDKIQKMNFALAKGLAGFFNQMIVAVEK
ncbi:MAG: C39 family peptidase [Candidatus Gracilibacteria bacterium]|nr:C39 family peptidase [Candidatus Gracilibacteria bacterium]MDD2909162.1 C39 family peptidase [Candidatus Gracilibacteria bacterium]